MTSLQYLDKIALQLRKELIIKHMKTKMAHIGSDFSCLNILITLYTEILGEKDRFVLSKGHAALALYAVLHHVGILTPEIYKSLGRDGSILGEHPLYGLAGLEFATGSLGHGLALAAGMALAKKSNLDGGLIYVLLSDGECQEGSTMEAMNFIARQELDNLICIIDSNKWQAYDRTLLPVDKIMGEFKAGGWRDIKEVNGRSFEEIYKALSDRTLNGPRLVISHSIMAMGVKSMEDQLQWHYMPPTKREADLFLAELEGK